MNDILEVLKSRRTVRNYKSKPLKEELLKKVIEAVQCSQSWNNSQCWEIVVIENPEIRKKIQETVPSKNPSYRAIVESSVLIALCGKTKKSGFFGDEQGSVLGDWMMYDLGIATQNLCNEAHSLGLGTSVVGWFDHTKAKEIINVPEGYELVSLIPLGYPGHKGNSPERKEIGAFVHKDTFRQ
ncbi:MAG: nitroreductase [Proteobacteria bacterium]|nr:nitroreductase [Pseudomonadota bacterium]